MVQSAAGGVSGVAAVVIMFGLAIAHFATSSRQSAEVVVAGITIVGTLIGGFLAAPYLNEIALGSDSRHQDDDLS